MTGQGREHGEDNSAADPPSPYVGEVKPPGVIHDKPGLRPGESPPRALHSPPASEDSPPASKRLQ